MTPSKLMGPLHHLQASMPPEHNDSPKLRKKAVLIGINYQLPHGDASCEVDTQDTEMLGIKSSSHEQDGILPTELQGCQRDALDMREFLISMGYVSLFYFPDSYILHRTLSIQTGRHHFADRQGRIFTTYKK